MGNNLTGSKLVGTHTHADCCKRTQGHTHHTSDSYTAEGQTKLFVLFQKTVANSSFMLSILRGSIHTHVFSNDRADKHTACPLSLDRGHRLKD